MNIPESLVEAVRERRCVLFFGAGASAGAKNDAGEDIPLASGLAKEIDAEFLKKQFSKEEFRIVYDYACSNRDIRTVQRFIHHRLLPFWPSDHHLLIPKFNWAGLVSTNYDLIIERAYETAGKTSLQKLNVWRSDGNRSSTNTDTNSVIYNKIHGCITEYDSITPPLVASTEQLIAFRNGREGQLATFLEWAKTKTIVFCGYRFGDSNLRTAFQEIVKEGDGRPRHYLVLRDPPEAAITYWADRRVTVISSRFSDFLVKLDNTISVNQRRLSSLSLATRDTPLTRYISVAGTRESDNLTEYLHSHIDLVHANITSTPVDAKAFYQGYNQAWAPIIANLDISRNISAEIISDHIIAPSISTLQRIAIIKGHAGSGKTILLRRLAWETANTHSRLTFFASRVHKLDYDLFVEILDLTREDIYLYVDNVAEHMDELIRIIDLFAKRRRRLVVTGAESVNIWNALCGDLEPHVSYEYEVRYLSAREIADLLSKLRVANSLGHLASLGVDKQVEAFTKSYGRQLLVALIEATSGLPLVEIVSNEYNSIPSVEARLLYLDICCLHRFGPPVRAGLISRLHNISFDEFKDRFFSPLSHIVRLRLDSKIGDYVYEARHAFIANLVYERALETSETRFENLSRILSKLNPSFSYDSDVAARLLKSDNLERSISNPPRIRQLFDIAEANFGSTLVILHQRSIYELHQASSIGELAKAEELLRQAMSIEPYNRSLKHTLAEIDLKRSRVAHNGLEVSSWRAKAVSQASDLTAGASSPYPYHTILKAKLDEVRESLNAGDDTALTTRLGEAINGFENTLRTGLQRFPNDPLLLSVEGEFFQVLENQPRAERAFRRAFDENTRSTISARRLVKLLRARKAFDEAEKVLQAAIEANPSDKALHFELSMVILDSSSDADQTRSEELLYHLRRSFTSLGSDFYAQFWYARQLLITGRVGDALTLFETLGEVRIPFSEKTKVQGFVLDGDGNPRRFRGTLAVDRATYSIFSNSDPVCRVFFYKKDSVFPEENFSIGRSATYELGFNLVGPCAVNLKFT